MPKITFIGAGSTITIKTVGLCHSVSHTAAELAHDIKVPIEEISYLVAIERSWSIMPKIAPIAKTPAAMLRNRD